MYYIDKIYRFKKFPFTTEFEYAETIPIGKDIWAFAYKEDDRATNYICSPSRGVIKEDKYFYEYKVNNKDLKKNGVSIYARYFADTYEEAVKGYNALLQERIEHLKNEISKLDLMIIKL